MSRLALIARTIPKLGLLNVARVTLYQLGLKMGWRPQPIRTRYPGGPILSFDVNLLEPGMVPAPTTLSVFGWYPLVQTAPPDWHDDPIGCLHQLNPDQDWAQALRAVCDGDVKNYWELSRFYWLPQFALAARYRDRDAATRIELWMDNWISSNPPFRGINWACGQEAAIRLMNLALSALILDCWRDPSPAMQWLVEMHVRRIRPTLSYALGQDNNHGTAEACALFIAGTWGQRWAMPDAAQIERTGRRWLNDRALRMIQSDGSPCQYSTTYHRANLEGFSMAGLWSARTGARGLHADAAARVAEGARWLHAIVDPASGDAPNLGANDSSHLFNVPESPYRDFRPTVALAAALFANARPWANYVDPRLAELGVEPGITTWSPAPSRSYDEGGVHILRRGKALALMHYPRFRFRPSQADVLHVDLWHNGINLLRDAGSFSYSAEGAEWFSGTAAHNTITFDGRDQMPRLGRFLFGDWLRAYSVEHARHVGATVSAAAAYSDAGGAKHHRSIVLSENLLVCQDTISGAFQDACLRWRLSPGDWQLKGKAVSSNACSIAIEVDGSPITPIIGTTLESLYYQHKSEIPEISINVNRPSILITKISF